LPIRHIPSSRWT